MSDIVLDPNQYREYLKYKYSLFADVGEVCKNLLDTDIKVKYYIESRLSKEAQNKFDIGYFPNNNNIKLLIDKIGFDRFSKLIKKDCFIYEKKVFDGSFYMEEYVSTLNNHNMIIPYKDLYGNTIAFIGRTILSEDERKKDNIQKYKFTRFNKSLHLFGFDKAIDSIRKTKKVIIVEGQLDCITCHDHGVCNVVALGGVSLSKHQFALLRRYADIFYLLLDNDDSGQNAQEKIINTYSKRNVRIIKLKLPNECKDIDQYLRTYGIREGVLLTDVL